MNQINLRNFNRKVKPGDDFFEFVNGGWIKHNPIPAAEMKWGSFYELWERNLKNLHLLIKQVAKKNQRPGSDAQKISDFFRAAMDIKKINATGLKPLESELARINAIKSVGDLIKVIAHLHTLGVSSVWYPNVEQDDKNSSRMIFRLYQHGLGLPDRDHYLKTDPRSKEVRKEYIWYISNIFKLAGYKPAEAKSAANQIIEFETRLARASMTRVEQRDVHKMYNKFTLAKLKKISPNIEWGAYFQGIGIRGVKDPIVSQPNFIKEVSLMAKNVALGRWQQYLRFHLISDFSAHLGDKFEKESFHFYGTILNGIEKIKPRWKRVVNIIDDAFGEALGRLYVEKFFPNQAKQKMDQLVVNVTNAYADRIKKLDWMSAPTKKKALKKLSAIVCKIGYPKKWRDYSKLSINRDSHLQNIISAEAFEFKRTMAKFGKPIDRDEWFMSPPTVNAYYGPNMNEIVFPAGILQSPYFSGTDDALDYGAIGAIIGHELTHGFDDQGSHFDEKGSLRNWWTKQDRKRFMKKAEVLVKQFDAYVAIDDLHVNGKLTLGENIADLGGLAIGYDAFQIANPRRMSAKIAGFTPEQRFFIGFAIGECAAYRPKALRERTLVDPHSPAKYRVNGALSNCDIFYEIFDVKEDNALYRPKVERAKIW